MSNSSCPGFGMELILLPVAAVGWIWYGNNVDNSLMFSVVAMKSRTSSSFAYSANEQVCRSCEGAQPGSQPKLASGNIPCRGHHARFSNGGWLGEHKAT